MKRKILYALYCVLGFPALCYLGLWAFFAWHGGLEVDAVTGTPNEDAQTIAEKTELIFHEHTGECNYLAGIRKLGYPKIVAGKDGRKYLVNIIIRFDVYVF